MTPGHAMSAQSMLFAQSDRSRALATQLEAFMATHVYRAEAKFAAHAADPVTRWTPAPLLQVLQDKARADGLWNLFLPGTDHGAGLGNLEYAPLAECMGRSSIAPEILVAGPIKPCACLFQTTARVPRRSSVFRRPG